MNELIAVYTAHVLRDMLLSWELTDIERARVISAIYHIEVHGATVGSSDVYSRKD